MTSVDPPIILVSGLPRSGSSMMMRVLEAGGVPIMTDGLRKPDPDNPRGYYEFEPAKRLDDFGWVAAAGGKAVKLLYSPVIYRLPAAFRYKVIFMRRELGEIVASQGAMLGRMGGTELLAKPARTITLYRIELDKVAAWLARQENVATKYVDYNRALADRTAICAEIKQFLGLALDETRMAAVIDPALYRQRAPRDVPK